MSRVAAVSRAMREIAAAGVPRDRDDAARWSTEQDRIWRRLVRGMTGRAPEAVDPIELDALRDFFTQLGADNTTGRLAAFLAVAPAQGQLAL